MFGLTLSEITESGIKTIKGNVSAEKITFEGEEHDIPTAKVVRSSKGEKVPAKVTIDGATSNDPIFIGIIHHDELWCADEGVNYGSEAVDIVQNCDQKSRSDDYESTNDTYYYLDSENVKDYVLVNFMESFAGGTMGLSKIYERGKPIDTFDKYIGEVKVTDSKTSTDYYFVGYGHGRKTTEDIKSGSVRFSNLMDLTTETAGTTEWHFAYYAERKNTLTVDLTQSNLDDLQEINETYYTYKFQDKENGMTIGELKQIDHKFAELWKKIEEKKGPNHILITKGVDGEPEEANDETLINEDFKITVGAIAGLG